jgi:hypothetical protein
LESEENEIVFEEVIKASEDDEDTANAATTDLEDDELCVLESCMNCRPEHVELEVAEQNSIHHGRK